jgi:uncharacterized protein YecT (DUF1311 family)
MAGSSFGQCFMNSNMKNLVAPELPVRARGGRMRWKMILVVTLVLCLVSLQVIAQEQAVTFGRKNERADISCSYCGTWIPFSGMYGAQYSSRDVVIVSKTALTLPGCSSVQTRLRKEIIDNSVVPYDTTLPKSITVQMQLAESPKCARAMSGVSAEAVIEIRVRPGRFQNSEELEINVFKPIENNGQTLSMPSAGWWAIRADYKPCDEGHDRGMFICASIAHRKADDVLNDEWHRLISAVGPREKAALISQQKQWLKASAAKCSKELSQLSPSASVPFNLATELSCLADNFRVRSQEIHKLYKCIQSSKGNCAISLATMPTAATHTDTHETGAEQRDK